MAVPSAVSTAAAAVPVRGGAKGGAGEPGWMSAEVRAGAARFGRGRGGAQGAHGKVPPSPLALRLVDWGVPITRHQVVSVS